MGRVNILVETGEFGVGYFLFTPDLLKSFLSFSRLLLGLEHSLLSGSQLLLSLSIQEGFLSLLFCLLCLPLELLGCGSLFFGSKFLLAEGFLCSAFCLVQSDFLLRLGLVVCFGFLEVS